MSDNFYSMELLAREKARWVEAEMQRRQMLVRAQTSYPPVWRARLQRFLGDVLIRVGLSLRRRAGILAG